MASSFSLTNKIALITGASSGIGKATAKLFAQRGASILMCDKDGEKLKTSVEQCIQASGSNSDSKRFVSAVGDLTDGKVREFVVGKAIDSFQRLDVLVCNAGCVLTEANGVSNVSEAIYDELFNTNVKSTFFLIQAALPHLEKSKGNIVNLSSITSTVGNAKRPIYPMTKAAIDHMTRCLALDLAPRGIRVNAVNPSFISTNIWKCLGDNYIKLSQEMALSENTRQPLYGECVTPEAIAEGIAYLASDAAKYVTGQCHVIDGGRCFHGASIVH